MNNKTRIIVGTVLIIVLFIMVTTIGHPNGPIKGTPYHEFCDSRGLDHYYNNYEHFCIKKTNSVVKCEVIATYVDFWTGGMELDMEEGCD